MKHQLSVFFILIISIYVCSSCTKDIVLDLPNVDYNKNIQKKSILTKSISQNDTTSNITSFDDIKSFYDFLNEKVTSNIDYKRKGNTVELIQPYSFVNKRTIVGCTQWAEYNNCKDLEIRFSDFQTADKLGLIANKTYFVSICEVCYFLNIGNNDRPSVSQSPECGLLMDDPRTDNFVLAERGYVGSYNATKNIFSMYTNLVYFLDYTDNPKIWFPCIPEQVKWNANILTL